MATMFVTDLLPRETAEQEHAKNDKKNIRKPDQQLGVGMRVSAQRIANDHKEKIRRRDDQTHGKADGSFTAMRGHTERDTDDRERHARERKRKTFIDFRSRAWRSRSSVSRSV